MLKRLMSVFLVCLMVMCVFAGCSEPASAPVSEDESEQESTGETEGYDLLFWCAADMVMAQQGDLMLKWVEDYPAANDDVNSISLVPMGDAERITAIMAGVGLPDCFFDSARNANNFYYALDLLDLTPLFEDEEWASGYYPEAIEYVTMDEKQWAIPFISYVSIVFRNLDVLEECGIDTTREYATIDEFIADLETVTNAGKTATHSWSAGSWYGTGAILGADADNITVGVEDGKTTVQPEQLHRSLEYLLKIESYANTMPYGDDATIEAFKNGDIAMMLDGPWTEPGIQEAGTNYDVILVPPYEAGGRTGGAQGWDYFYGVSSDDEARNDAVRGWLKFLGSYEAEKDWTVHVGRPTLREDVMSDEEVLQTMMCKVSSEGLNGGIRQMNFMTDSVFWMGVFTDVAPALVAGQYTVEEAAVAAIDAVNDLYADAG